jgi:hypothetical protein
MDSVGDILRAQGLIEQEPRQWPLWKGPESSDEQGGITFSLLSRFLVCRERFRLLVVEGLKPNEGWNFKLGYGNMWHTCEEALAAGCSWESALANYARTEAAKYKYNQDVINHWYSVCLVQFPIYIDYWQHHTDETMRKPLLEEQPFNIGYTLPSGRVVYLRGKWDSVDWLPAHREGITDYSAGVWLKEIKSKGDIKEQQMMRQLKYDMQTLLYLTALKECPTGAYEGELIGVRYNVVRRPLSGGKGTIVRSQGTKGSKCSKCKGAGVVTRKVYRDEVECDKCLGRCRIGAKPEETYEAFYGRLSDVINENKPDFFMRWKTAISAEDIATFQRQTLNPILEQLCDWWDWIQNCEGDPFSSKSAIVGPPQCGPHWRHPFGVWNSLLEGGATDYDTHLENGSIIGLEVVDNLFPELQEQ